MAFSTKTGQVTQPTSTGNQATTGMGFQPKAVLFWWGGEETASGSAANYRMGFGFAQDSTHRGFCWAGDADAGTPTTNSSHNFNTTKCIFFGVESGATPTTKADADFVSMDSDGFTINWTTADATQRIVNYMALGGADLTNSFASSFQQNNTTTNQAITGVGFQPDCIILCSSNSAALGVGADNSITISFITPSSQVISHAKGRNAAAVGSTHQDSWQKTDFLAWIGSNSDLVQGEASYVSMDSDGFTFISSPAGTRMHLFLALKGGNYKSGVFGQNTSNGNQSLSGFGFQPTGVLFKSIMKAASVNIDTTGARLMFGGASSSSARAVNSGATNNTILSSASHNLDTANVIKTMTEGGASPTILTVADFVSNDSGGFTINNTTTDATSREISYLAFGSTAVAGVTTNFLSLMGLGT